MIWLSCKVCVLDDFSFIFFTSLFIPLLDLVKFSLIFDFLPSAPHLFTVSQLHLAGLYGIVSAMSDPCLQHLCKHSHPVLSQDHRYHTSVFCHALFGSETHMPSNLYWCLPLLFLMALFQCEITLQYISLSMAKSVLHNSICICHLPHDVVILHLQSNLLNNVFRFDSLDNLTHGSL